MKIVHVLTRLNRGGAEENTLACCRGQLEQGHAVTLIHGREYDVTLRSCLPPGIRLVTLESLVHAISPVSDVTAYVRLTRLLRSLRPDIVHTHQSKAGIIGRLAAKSANVPGIVHGVHILPFVNVGAAHKMFYLAAERFASAVTRAFISVSRTMSDICINHGIGAPNNHFVVHSGFDLTKFSRAPIPADHHLVLGTERGEPRPPVVLMLAALEPRKRHAEFIEAFELVTDKVPNARLVLAGEGPARPCVEAAIARSPVRENIRLIGFSSEPERLIALADICVLVSMREGLPRVVMQYLAGGRACVVSELPGISEVVTDGVNGVVTPPDDVAAAAAAIADLLQDSERLATLAAGARATDLSSWTTAAMCHDVEMVYRTIAAAPAALNSAPH